MYAPKYVTKLILCNYTKYELGYVSSRYYKVFYVCLF